MILTERDLQRFWSRVRKTGTCWLWTASTSEGYGQLWINELQRAEGTHRISFIIHRRPIPKGMYVCHKCDQPLCVNPNHLFLGTPKENTHDSIRKGRFPRGETHSSSFLNETAVREIRSLIHKVTQKELAKRYGVSRTTIYDIVHRRRWAHVD